MRHLVASQFPEWAGLQVERVALDGWDNTTFRLGDSMSVRLPSADAYAAQVEKEHRWLPVLRGKLPLPIPEPLAMGSPTAEFPRPWSVYRWLPGDTASDATVKDPVRFARDLAAFLKALYGVDATGGPPAGPHSFSRGAHVSVWDRQTRDAIQKLEGRIDARGAGAVWDAAVGAASDSHAVWVHGDITGSNLLVQEGRLSAVIDFGCCAVGDPACDLTIAWTFFEGESRALFKQLLPLDAGVWARGRGWALWKALLQLVRDVSEPGYADAVRWRAGWRLSAAETVDAVIAESRGWPA